jgi:hypothetical protein
MKTNNYLAVVLSFLSIATHAQTQNVALGKNAYSSSLENGNQYPVSNAVDGNGAGSQITSNGSCSSGNCTRWSSGFSDPQWMYIDLGGPYNITAVKLYWEVANAKEFAIQVSNNAIIWTDIQTITNNTSFSNSYTFSNVSGRYVRMYGTARNTVYGYSLWEFEVYGTAIILPVKLTGFSASAGRQGVALNWRAHLDKPTFFNVERSPDAIHFSTVGSLTLTPAGNSSTGYFLDAQLLGGKSYYRLAYREAGTGTLTYSGIVPVTAFANNGLSIYPNPVKGGNLYLNLPPTYIGPVELTVRSVAGNLISKQMVQAGNTTQLHTQLKTGLVPGLYWLDVVMQNQPAAHLKLIVE